MSASATARIPIARLAGRPKAWLFPALFLLLSFAAAFVFRSIGSAHGAGRALLGVFSTLALPLVSFALVSIATCHRNLVNALEPMTLFGTKPATAALTLIVTTVLSSAIVLSLSGALVVAIGHGSNDPPLSQDLPATAVASFLGGAAYAAWFLLGSTWGKKWGGRLTVIVLDFLFGAKAGALGLLFPRGNLRVLLGGDTNLAISGRAASLSLLAICILASVLTVLRVRRQEASV